MKFRSPRPLTAVERTVLGMLLSAEFPGADVLREQARSAVAVGRCDCGCPSVYLEVSAEVPAVGEFASRLAPAEGVVSAAGQEGAGEIICSSTMAGSVISSTSASTTSLLRSGRRLNGSV